MLLPAFASEPGNPTIMTALMEVIFQCWPTIEQYADVESLVSASKSCRAMHHLVIDADSGKIRTSSLMIVVHSSDDRRLAELRRRAQQPLPAPMRNPGYAPSVLNAVHFPSLIRMNVGFPQEPERTMHAVLNALHFPSLTRINGIAWNDEEIAGVDQTNVALHALSSKMSRAENLEELVLDIGSLVGRERRVLGDDDPDLYAVLGENLAGCVDRSRRLTRLKLFNDGTQLNGVESRFSGAFLAAMVPVLRAGRDCIEEVTLLCGDVPISEDHDAQAATEFFAALFGLRRLKALRVQLRSVHGPLWGAMVNASKTVAFPSRSLEELSVMVPDVLIEEGHVRFSARRTETVAPLLRLCRDVPSLRRLVLHVPSWDADSVSALGRALEDEPPLEDLAVNFYGHEDEGGRILDLAAGLLRGRRASDDGLRVKLKGLCDVDEESASFATLSKHRARNGEACLREDDDGGWSFVL